jgi:hypothetical protein
VTYASRVLAKNTGNKRRDLRASGPTTLKQLPVADPRCPFGSGEVTIAVAGELLLQRESHTQQDLIMAYGPVFDMTSGLHDFEPFHLANGL